MRFFVDENFEKDVAAVLAMVYPSHEFVSAYVDPSRYCGVDDVILFPMIADDGFDAIVTQDRAQMEDFAERMTLFEAGLHWVGQRQIKDAGAKGLAFRLATVTAGLALVLEDPRADPHLYRLKGVETQPGQRIASVYAVWHPTWGAQPA